MKKYKIILTMLMTTLLAGCNPSTSNTEQLSNSDDEVISSEEITGTPVELNVKNDVPIRFASVYDEVDEDGTITYNMIAKYNDLYDIICDGASKIEIFNKHKVLIKETTNKTTIELNKDDEIYVRITHSVGEMFNFEVMPYENYLEFPYDINTSIDTSTLKTHSDNYDDPLKPFELKHTKRDDGKGLYVNCNNPEKITSNEFDTCLTRQEVTDKEVFFTFEHNNANNLPYYYGYRVTNTDDKDIYVTVKNLGYQIDGAGSWLGEDEWIKFYNIKFKTDTSNYTTSQKNNFNAMLGFSGEYDSEFRQPITYRIPAGKYIYVMGGTTKDAYKNINVFSSANKRVRGGCSNGAVIFSVSGGAAEGSFLVYRDADASKINNSEYVTSNKQTGYVITRDGVHVGSQYVGYDTCHGVVDADLMWTFNDSTPAQNLPVKYENPFYTYSTKGTPYSEIKSFASQKFNDATSWITHLNPNHTRNAIGTDMTKYITVDSVTQEPISIDVNHYDGNGSTANIGNWMVDYSDTITLVNQGNNERTFTYELIQNGVILAFVRDQSGHLCDTYDPTYCVKIPDNPDLGDAIYEPFNYSIKVPAHSVVQFTVNYNLLANANGAIRHTATLK